jgi:hypothetical protein
VRLHCTTTSMLGFKDWVKQHLSLRFPQHASGLSALSLGKRRKRTLADAEVLISTPELDDLIDRGQSRVTFQRHMEIFIVPNRDELSHYHKARLWWTRDDYLAFREAYYDYLLSQERSESSESDVSCDEATLCLHIRSVPFNDIRFAHILTYSCLIWQCTSAYAAAKTYFAFFTQSHVTRVNSLQKHADEQEAGMYFCKADDGVSQYAVSTPRSWNDSFGEVLTGRGIGKGRGLQAPSPITFDSYDSDEDSSSSSDGDADCESEAEAPRTLESLCSSSSSSSSTTMVLEGARYELQTCNSSGSISSSSKSSSNKFLVSPAATEAMSESESDCEIARDLNALRRRHQHVHQHIAQQYAMSH